jgi:hypothetical protein
MWGRLIRMQRYRGDIDAILYVVAEAGPDQAIAALRSFYPDVELDFEDLGRASHKTIEHLGLKPGELAKV